jgi:hypothetical protein
MTQSIEQFESIVLYSHLAKAEGIELTQKDISDMDKSLDTLRTLAEDNNMTLNKYLSASYGRGMTEELYRTYLERMAMAGRYETYHREAFEISDSDVQSHYDENSRDFDRVTYRQFSVTKRLTDEEFDAATAAGENPEETVVTPIGEMTAGDKKAYDKAAQLADNPELTEENFNELAMELAVESEKSYYQDNPDYSKVTDATYSSSALMDWLFEAGRGNGDVTVIDNDTTFTAVMFLSRKRLEENTVNVRDMVIMPTGDSESEWNEASAEADGLYNPMEEAPITEEDFAKLADENSDQYTVEPGSLSKEVKSGQLAGGDEVNAWAFDSARKSGDTTMIKGTDGYHILYFVSAGRPAWQVDVEKAIRDSNYESFRMEKEVGLGNVRNEFGMSFITKI